MTRSLTLTPLHHDLGVEVRGLDVAGPMSDELTAELVRLVLAHRVVVLPDQALDVDQHVAFGQRFGHLARASPVRGGLDDRHPEVRVIDNRRWDGQLDVWHGDLTYLREPSALSIMYARVVPVGGGAVSWASTESAYDRLDPELRDRIEDRVAEHYADRLDDYVRTFGPGTWAGQPIHDVPPVTHPVVRVHPETRRRGLFVNPWATRRIIGLPDAESAAVLASLFDELLQPDHQLHVVLDPGTLVLADTRCTVHHVGTVPTDHVQIIHRLNVEGSRPAGPA